MNIFRSHLIPIMMLIPILSAFGYTAVTIYNQEYSNEAPQSSKTVAQEMVTTSYNLSNVQEQDIHKNNTQEKIEEE